MRATDTKYVCLDVRAQIYWFGAGGRHFIMLFSNIHRLTVVAARSQARDIYILFSEYQSQPLVRTSYSSSHKLVRTRDVACTYGYARAKHMRRETSFDVTMYMYVYCT